MLAAWVAELATVAAATPGCDAVAEEDVERIDVLRGLEELKSAAAAAQARVAVAFEQSQHALQVAAGVPSRRVGIGVAGQVALARRDSAVRGARHLGLAQALVREMPQTMAALTAGVISEWRATLLVRGTSCLSRADRAVVDAELAARPGGLAGLGDQAVAAETARVAYRLDPHAFTARARKAESERRVTCRPAPDTMAVVSALLPATQGIAVYAALLKHAETRRSAGDHRTRGQVMADTLVERVTGQTSAAAVPVEVHVVVTDRALVRGDAEPAHLQGYGPVPAPLVRADLRELPAHAKAWLRRLYTHPVTGGLVAMDSTRRLYTGRLRQLLVIRDQTCRTPWCDAPIRHLDHVVPSARRGATSAGNGQGLCEACNHAKEAAGWRAEARPDGSIVTETPTGHRYRSHPPPLPGSRLETDVRNLILSA